MATRKQVAEALGISRQRVEKLLKEGRIEEKYGSIDLDKARKAYHATLDPARRASYEGATASVGGTAAPQAPDDDDKVLGFAEARTEKERANAKRAQLEYRIKAGHYILRDEVAAKEFAIARKIRDRILGFPAKMANLVPPDAMKTITDECEALVREIQAEVATIAEGSA